MGRGKAKGAGGSKPSRRHWSHQAAERIFRKNDPGWAGWSEPRKHEPRHQVYGKAKEVRNRDAESLAPGYLKGAQEPLPPRHFVEGDDTETIRDYRETQGLRIAQHYPEKHTKVICGRPVQARSDSVTNSEKRNAL